MKGECPNCGAIYQIGDLKIPGNGTYSQCPKCGTRFLLPNRSEEMDSQKKEFICPKCGHRQKPSEECTKCGIIFSKYHAFQANKQEKLEQGGQEKIEKRQGLKKWLVSKPAIILVGIACVVGFLVVYNAVNQSRSKEYYKKGTTCYYSGNYERALENYDRAIELNPKYALAFYNRALAWFHLGEDERALENYDRAIELNPKYALAFYNRGISWNNLGEYDRAIEDFDRSIELNPKYAATFHNRGISWYYLGEYDRAFKDFEKSIKLNPKYAQSELWKELKLKRSSYTYRYYPRSTYRPQPYQPNRARASGPVYSGQRQDLTLERRKRLQSNIKDYNSNLETYNRVGGMDSQIGTMSQQRDRWIEEWRDTFNERRKQEP